MIRTVLFFIVGMFLSDMARADIIVKFGASSNSISYYGTVPTGSAPLYPDGTRTPVSFSIQNPNDGYWQVYSDNPGVDSLGTISFTGVSNRKIHLIVGVVGWNPYSHPGAGAFVDWTGGVSEGGNYVAVQASVNRNLLNLSVSRITRLLVGGVMAGSFGHTETSNIFDGTDVPRDIIDISVAGYGVAAYPANLTLYTGELQSLGVRNYDAIGSIGCLNSASVGVVNIPNGSFIGSVTTSTGRISSVLAGQYLGGTFSTGGGNIETIRAGISGSGDIGVALSGSDLVYRTATISAGGIGTVGTVLSPRHVYANVTAGGLITRIEGTTGRVCALTADGQSLALGLIKSNNNNVALVRSGLELYSNVEAPAGKVGQVDAGQDVYSNISSRDGCDSIAIARDLFGNITLNKGLAAGSLIRIGRTIDTNSEIVLNKAAAFAGGVGLAGQIIVNSQATIGSLGGVVRVNQGGALPQIVVSTSDYEVGSATLGNGAVGVVPFRLYNTDSTAATYNSSTPVTLGYYLDSRFVNDPPKVAFYGPVKLTGTPVSPGRTQPFKVEVVSADGTVSIDVTKKFKAVIDPANNRIARLQFAPENIHEFLLVGRYRITNDNPETNEVLACDLPGTGVVPVDMGAGLVFDIGRDCDSDWLVDYLEIFGGNGTTGDIGLDSNGDGFLDTCVDPASPLFCIADLNGDFLVSDADFVIFVNAYNTLQDSTGDMNGDLITNDDDFALFAQYYNALDCAEYLNW